MPAAAHNSRLKQLLTALNRQTHDAKTEQELLDVIEQVIRFGAPLTYQNKLQYTLAGLLAFSAAVWLLFQHNLLIQRPSKVLNTSLKSNNTLIKARAL